MTERETPSAQEIATLSSSADKLALEVKRLSRDVRHLLEFFADAPPDNGGPAPAEAPYEKTLAMTLYDVRIAARSIRACETDISFIRNALRNADLSSVFRRD